MPWNLNYFRRGGLSCLKKTKIHGVIPSSMYVLDAILNLLADSKSQAKVKFPPEMLSALQSNGPPSSQAIQTALAIRMEPAEEVTRLDAESASLSKKIRLLESQILDLKKRRQAPTRFGEGGCTPSYENTSMRRNHFPNSTSSLRTLT